VAFTDNFAGTDGQNLEDRSGWTLVDGAAGAAQINASNQLKCSSAQSTGSYKCTDQGSADHYTQAAIRGSGTQLLCARLTNGSNFIGARRETSAWQLYKRVAGVFTQLGASASTYSAGDVLKLEANGNSLTAYKNGSAVIGPVTDSFNNTETRQGLSPRSAALNPWLDNFEAGALSASAVVEATAASSGTSSVSADTSQIGVAEASGNGSAATSASAASLSTGNANSTAAATGASASTSIVISVASSGGVAVANADAENAASGTTIVQSDANGAGTSTGDAISASMVQSDAVASGVALASGATSATYQTNSSSAGESDATGSAAAIIQATADASGSTAAEGVSAWVSASVGDSAGSSSVQADAENAGGPVIIESVASAAGASAVLGRSENASNADLYLPAFVRPGLRSAVPSYGLSSAIPKRGLRRAG
jgi:hypothetical protein